MADEIPVIPAAPAVITVDQVKNGIAYGEYETYACVSQPGRKQSPAWLTFFKIRSTVTKVEVKNGTRGFYYCRDCKEILHRDISNGLSPLTTHQKSHERNNTREFK